MNSHDEAQTQILRYAQDDLNAQERAEFSRHLQVCGKCRGRVEEEMALSRMFQEAAPLYIAPAELRARVAALVATGHRSWNSPKAKLRVAAAQIGYEIQKSLRLSAYRWLPAMSAVLIAIACFWLSRSLLQELRARDYVESAVAAHRDMLDGRLPFQIQSDAPEAVTRWAGQRVSLHFQLPVPQDVLEEGLRFRLAGARIVELARGRGVMVMYYRRDQIVSLLIAPANTAVVAGGDEVRDGRLLFHYRSHASFNVITWNNHGLAYALVSSVSGPARQSCLVCHKSLPAH